MGATVTDVGGWGMPEAEPHLWTNFGKYHPRKAGVMRYHLKRNPSFCPTVNLDKLPTVVSEQTWVNTAQSKNLVLPSLMWSIRVCYKVVGKGRLRWAACHGEGQIL